jgi:hypothetical protein
MLERTASAWRLFAQKDLLPSEMRAATEKQTHKAIANVEGR